MANRAKRGSKKDNVNLFKDGLNWDKYLQICNLPAAPKECFAQNHSETLVNNFQVYDKLEAQDPRSPTSVCLSTVVSLQGLRILLRLDGGDACNDFWRLVDSGDIYPLGTQESKGILLQPPLGYTRNMSTWSNFLAKNREKGKKAGKDCFLPEPQPPDQNLFELGMKLEAVDRKNPDLICPATIGDIKGDQVFVSFDGWRGAMDYWCQYACRDLFPVGWCYENDHPLTNPGNKGDNPAVEERLKQLADKSKRQTRSGAGNITETEKGSGKNTSNEGNSSGRSESPYVKSTRGRGRNRVSRSLTPVTRTAEVSSKSPAIRDDRLPTVQGSSVTESSADSETCDSSVSSQQSSESSSSENEAETSTGVEPKKQEDQETEDNNDDLTSDIDESVVEVKNSKESESLDISSARKKEKHEKRLKKRRKIKKKYKRMYQLGEIDSKIYKERKRFASTGDENHFLVRSKKRKKNKRKHSMSSVYDSPRKRILGFGTQTSTSLTNFATQSLSLQSPSFLEHTSPTSLFGFSRDEIVKKATEGWPSRLMGSSKMVVTSDNKLGKFGSSKITENSCQTTQAETKGSNNDSMDVDNAQVTTTTQIDEQKITEKDSKQPDSTTSEILSKISSQTVSSTTNPLQSPSPQPAEPRSPKETKIDVHIRESSPLEEPRRKMSRNPQRWTVSDVVSYVRENESALVNHIHLFQTHEIDGQALLLLNSSLAVKYMNMKLGPALKLASLVERVKQLVSPPRSSAE
uniref:polycomb protein SCMH1-like n=1 Tax=Styela clava TaxID=7725 RepID=UPI00193A8327|nr:polycomb protein SCMH1-like [Styela clava]